MKNLGNLQDKQTALSRLGQVRNDSRRAWGKMSPPQMICHLSDAFRVALGERQVTPQDNLFTRTLLKWGGLWVPVPWPLWLSGTARNRCAGNRDASGAIGDRQAGVVRLRRAVRNETGVARVQQKSRIWQDVGRGLDALGLSAHGSSFAAIPLLGAW